jgi:GT2 family glycosyltransferase
LAEHSVTVAVPTLAAGPNLLNCLAGLSRQTLAEWEAVVVDNSGAGLARKTLECHPDPFQSPIRVIENLENKGFGAAVNQAWRGSKSHYLAVLNDDAVPEAQWLAEMVGALERLPGAGMCAPQVRLPDGTLDSAGMLVAADGSSKQRGHGQPPEDFAEEREVLLPSGSAALYCRVMVEQIGGFDEAFFLYCEDTDLGLRARRAGWKCVYAPKAVVVHAYSQTSGPASPLKAYYVERNRLFVLIRNFPLPALFAALPAAAARYFWHAVAARRGRGAAGRYLESGGVFALAWIAMRAHLASAAAMPRLWRERRRIAGQAELAPSEFARLLRRHAIGLREVAEL